MLRLFKIFLLLLAAPLAGQDFLSLDEALKIALEKNYDVVIARNERQIAGLQNNIGNAGMSPTVSVGGTLSNSSLNSYQVFNNGQVQDRPGAVAYGTGVSVNADWMVFDGLRMFAVKKRLKLGEELSEIALRSQMENTVYEVIAAYHNVARVRSLIRAAEQNLALYVERRKIAEVRLEIGSDSKVDLLLSKSDENRARSGIIQLQLELLDTKVRLNTLLGRSVETEFSAADTITLSYEPSFEELKKAAASYNSSLLLAHKNESIVEQGVAEARALRLPQVTVGAAYIFTRNQSQAGFVAVNRQNGLNAGLTARWNIFNGGRNHRLVQERNVFALNQKYVTERTKLDVDAQVFISYQAFLLNRQIVDMELQNLADSRQVLQISLERYKIGKTGLLETIETQKNLEDAQVRFINALYNTKLAEARLLRVNGSLVK